MENKYLIGIIVATVAFVGLAVRPIDVKPADIQIVTMGDQTLGASPGSDFFNDVRSRGMFTQGGGVLSTSTDSTAMVPTAATFDYGLIQVTPTVGDLTYTFPASSTLYAMIPSPGDSRTVMIYNASTTAGIDVIFAAGTGTEIKGIGSTPLTIDEASMGTLKFVRKANSDIIIFMTAAVAD